MSEKYAAYKAAEKQKATKPPVHSGVFAYFPRALKEVAKVSAAGAEKRGIALSDKGWLDPQITVEYIDNAWARHVLDRQIEGAVNLDPKDGGVRHLAQIAWGALAALEKELMEMEKDK